LTAYAASGAGELGARRLRFPKGLRLIPRLETYPVVVSFGQTILGKLTILATFGIALWYTNEHWPLLIVLLALMTALPKYRRLLLTFGTLLWALGNSTHWAVEKGGLATAAVLVLSGLLFWSAIRFRNSWFGRHAVATLLGGFALSVCAVSYFPKGWPIQAPLWRFFVVFSEYLWFIGYSLLDRNSARRDNFGLQLGTYRPFWGTNLVPYKGAAYLRRIEAQNPEQLSIAQIKGIKLFAWSLILTLVFKAFVLVVHGYWGIPSYADTFALSVHRAPFPWYIGWATLTAQFFEKLFDLSIRGHQIVACCRMAGFLALRNTYRPLTSRSIAEFWNRYFFYFKELLVDFFFYPTFIRYFKKWQRFRLFAATFVAACIGNAFCHFFAYMQFIEKLGFWKALAGFHVYIFYTVVLAVGIGISQLRQRRAERSHSIQGRLVSALCVVGFYCILSIFDYPGPSYSIQEHFRFLAHLFNLVS
jgi:hypothetical protein